MSSNGRTLLGTLLGALCIGLLLVGCTPTTTAPTVQKQGTLDHVVIIVEENKPTGMIIGSDDARYLNSLAQKYALATQYQAITNPSLPNYIALTSGTTAGITTDCKPSECTADVPSIAAGIEGAGRTWKLYAESMPKPCLDQDSGRYAVRHNPFMYYPSVADDEHYCAAHDVPFTQLKSDLSSASSLPDYSLIVPNTCHDMHDCSVSTGDDWLATHVPAILSSPAFTKQNSLLVITWDEGEKGDNGITTIFAGSAAKKSYSTDTRYDHYSLLHTIEADWGITPLTGNDKDAPLMDDMLKKPITPHPSATPAGS